MVANLRVIRTTGKLRLRVPSSLRSSVAGYAGRSTSACSIFCVEADVAVTRVPPDSVMLSALAAARGLTPAQRG